MNDQINKASLFIKDYFQSSEECYVLFAAVKCNSQDPSCKLYFFDVVENIESPEILCQTYEEAKELASKFKKVFEGKII